MFLLCKGPEGARPTFHQADKSVRFATYCTANACQTHQSFKYWFEKVFLPVTYEARSNGQYVCLILDNHSSHIASVDEIQSYLDEKVIVFFLLANTTQDSMVLDVSCFAPFKQKLRKLIKEKYSSQDDFSNQYVNLITESAQATITPSVIRAGFVQVGIISEDTLLSDVPVPNPKNLIARMETVSGLRNRVVAMKTLKTTEEFKSDELKRRLSLIKDNQLKVLYADCFKRGSTSILLVKTRSGAVIDGPYLEDLRILQNFQIEDDQRISAAKLEKKEAQRTKKEMLEREKAERKEEREKSKLMKLQMAEEKKKIAEEKLIEKAAAKSLLISAVPETVLNKKSTPNKKRKASKMEPPSKSDIIETSEIGKVDGGKIVEIQTKGGRKTRRIVLSS